MRTTSTASTSWAIRRWTASRSKVRSPRRARRYGVAPEDLRLLVPTDGSPRSEDAPCARAGSCRRSRGRPIASRWTSATADVLMDFYRARARQSGGSFDRGIESALQFILASPEFLFRFEPRSAVTRCAASDQVYRLGDLELASRLSFFLWSSLPDEQLLDAGGAGQAERAGGARAAGQAHAGRSALEDAHRQLRRAVAAPAESEELHPDLERSRTSTTTCGRR